MEKINSWNKENHFHHKAGYKKSKDLKTNSKTPQKKRINWKQSLRITKLKTTRTQKIRKSLQYLLLLKQFNNKIDYKNIKLLKAFLTKYGKIRARRKTRITVQQQNAISRAIRRARVCKLIPFTYEVRI